MERFLFFSLCPHFAFPSNLGNQTHLTRDAGLLPHDLVHSRPNNHVRITTFTNPREKERKRALASGNPISAQPAFELISFPHATFLPSPPSFPFPATPRSEDSSNNTGNSGQHTAGVQDEVSATVGAGRAGGGLGLGGGSLIAGGLGGVSGLLGRICLGGGRAGGGGGGELGHVAAEDVDLALVGVYNSLLVNKKRSCEKSGREGARTLPLVVGAVVVAPVLGGVNC
jgi:hypothetical protein